ncbi:cAMP-dependent protein kinase catalytic subunit alpha-like isoform X2 [Cimex lectularius]|nr:cAMP-dependent protein kinase catalytic subunit alpha-like isoform X2 [Cimex lectularius]
MSKQKIYDSKHIRNLLNEKNIMSALRFEFITPLKLFFQDNSYLYFVLPFLPGGDLYFHLKRFMKFPEPLAKFYICQLVLALEYLHSLDLVHRDVKPENIILDVEGFIKLTDFGFCKQVLGRTYTICGTPEYLAPELLSGKGYGKAVDWWSMGVMLFELVHGLTPFVQSDVEATYAQIQTGEYTMPSHFSVDLQDLINRLLQSQPSKRIGNYKRGAKDIKNHPFFNEIVWRDILTKNVVPPYRPYLKNPNDTSYFNTFDKEEPVYIAATNKFGDYFNDFDS